MEVAVSARKQRPDLMKTVLKAASQVLSLDSNQLSLAESSVLNASRHHRYFHSGGLDPDLRDDLCSTPRGITGTFT